MDLLVVDIVNLLVVDLLVDMEVTVADDVGYAGDFNMMSICLDGWYDGYDG